MSVKAIGTYEFETLDGQEKFHGNQLVYINWERHLMFCSPVCLPLPPELPFGALVDEVLPGIYSQHPDFEKIDWAAVSWQHNNDPFTPDPQKSLAENGITHKDVLRFTTPGLDGIKGSGS
ncbi:phenol hydroxylase subunit P4 [Luteithermobacter gelatinilyticus]|uniref:phenol hydroxylase subunit P4 n=1 Tax=Luteithermobacter gelatinilyticus TaxID=2582913 RepID=UPI001105A4E9|nr:phenol hydroxylase subunit P4 [Luteithermobacter gelatinilyticus]